MIVLEPVVTLEKLGELLNEQCESECLDYKSTCDLNDTRSLVEIAKDVGAMSITGGFIVIGATDQGTPSGTFSEDKARLFDEATLRAKLQKYIPDPIDLRCATHRINDSWITLVHVAPRQDGFCIFKADGNYSESGRTKTAFYAGQIYARHGSSSENWGQADIQRVIANIVALKKAEWRVELRNELSTLGVAVSAQNLARGPVAALNWKIDTEAFIATVTEQLRDNDTIPIKSLLQRAQRDVREILEGQEPESELTTLLDRFACLAATFINLEEKLWTPRSIKVLSSIYAIGFDEPGNEIRHPIPGHRIWVSIIERVMALGALAVRAEDWESVKLLATTSPPNKGNASFYPSWVRHGLTMGYRQNAFSRASDDRTATVSPINLARNLIRTEACFRPDLPSEDEGILTSLCQFDTLGAISTAAASGKVDTNIWYPCASHFRTDRSEPIVERLLSDKAMRSIIAPCSDDDLAIILDWIDRASTKEGFNYFGWDGFSSKPIRSFIDSRVDR
ncbi:hypothetical protein D7X55_34075 [Corallococcus sp. AB049A]|uniref:AlbA family DNA-binding domain-containing protein n=1 Tax=Corallococcus sp. AB049A TaxID=2316721 RepID=UPI000EEB8242|nr:ATP-binding protein [Corallococcus sp. AB049A]RKI51416.1 hypothetical protein D7X55_34075 [Corallococcus sp. AB049A]